MRKFAWIYMDRISGDLVLVQRSHRRAVKPTFRVMAGVWKSHGWRPDEYVGVSVRTMGSAEFRRRYEYFGGLNIKPRYGKKAVFDIETRGLDFDPYESQIEQFECPWD